MMSRTSTALLLIALSITAATAATATETDPSGETSRSLVAAADAGRWQEVAVLADRRLAEAPGDARALALRAEARRRDGRLEEARADYAMLADLHPDDPSFWFWIGTIDRWRGYGEFALEAYARALTLDLDHHGALTGRARVFLASERPAAAEAELRRALDAHPGDREASQLMAEALAAQRRLREARWVLAGVFDGAELARRQGDLELAAGRPGKALKRYRRALELDPDSPDTLRRLGEAERRRGDDLAALAAYRRAAGLEPDDLGSLYWVGVLATRAGRQGESLAAWEAILDRQPDNGAALVGKSRILFYRGRHAQALALADRALAATPDNGEARTLRAFILAARGRHRDAGSDYRAVLAADPGNSDARIGFERLADGRSWEISGLSEVSRVVEGLDDEGLMVDGALIRPTRIEYLSEGLSARLRTPVGDAGSLAVSLGQRREAVTQLDSGNPIYDLDVSDATAGLDHRLGDAVTLSWRVGGSRFSPRTAGSITEESRGGGLAAFDWRRGRFELRAAAERRPFIYRSFAADTQFRIFDHDRLSLRLAALLGSGVRLEAAAGRSDYRGDAASDSPASASLALRWQRGGQLLALVAHSSPSPERFLAADGALRFVDYQALRLEAASRLAAGFRLAVEAESGRYGATPRIVTVAGNKLEGPAAENSRVTGKLTLAWSPPGFRPLTLGVEGLVDDYDFDTPPYNTIDTVAGTAFVELAGETARTAYRLRAASSQVDDDRDPDYRRQAVELRLEAKLGDYAARGPLRLGVEGRLTTATLEGDAERFDEELPRVRLYLRMPF